MANADILLLEKKGGIAKMTLNRPEKLNALSGELKERLTAAIVDVRDDRSTRVLVITGAGRAFCGGGDVTRGSKEVFDETDLEAVRRTITSIGRDITLAIRALPIPTIAMVNGPAVGFGFELALSCDLRVASEAARFMIAFTRIGSVPPVGGVWILLRTIGLARTAELVYTGNFLEARQAEAWGLVNKVVKPEELEAETMALARKIATGPSVAFGLDKVLMYKGMEISLDAALQLGVTLNTVVHTTNDYREGIAAFREKRKANFKGK